jgi:AmmeMemoRadiSam system protein B
MRPAYLQNKWYPGDETDCRNTIDHFAGSTTPQTGTYKSLIAPHAGWAFSGQAMGQGYRWLSDTNPNIDLVVVFGAHRGPYGPTTVFCGDAWETPLGNLINALPIANQIKSDLGIASEPERPGRPDNAAEVHMPFVKHFFPKAELLMLGVPASETALGIGDTVERTCRSFSRETVFIGSTDLTHYGPQYDFMGHGEGAEAQSWVRTTNDRGFIKPLLEGRPKDAFQHAETHLSACCPGAALAAWQAAQNSKSELATGTEINHYLSSDVVPGDNFVGYCSMVF